MTCASQLSGPGANAPGLEGRHVPDTKPYPWPWDGQLSPSRMALVIVGGQRFFVAEPARHVLQCIDDCMTAVRAVGAPVVVLRHLRPGTAARPVLPTAGCADSDVLFPEADAVVDCYGLDGFTSSALDAVLTAQGTAQLLLVGLGLESAVHSTMRSANDRGYECLLVEDACASVLSTPPSVRSGAVSSICMSGGIFGAVGNTRAVTDALRELRPLASSTEGRLMS